MLRSLGKTNINHSKISCRFQLDIFLGTSESAVDFNSEINFTGYLYYSKQPLDIMILGKTNINHSKISCLFQLDIFPATSESAVEFNSTFDR